MDAIDRRRRAAAEAAQWWVRLEDGATHAAREEFTEWLRESALHVSEMMRTVQVHEALQDFPDWELVEDDSPTVDTVVVPLHAGQPPRESKRERFKLGIGLLLAASVAAVAIGAIFALQQTPDQTIETRRGERREIALTDGSVVQADSQTRLSVRFDERSRDINLESGRAVFRVARAADRPFTVRAGDTAVRALGTTFGVERRDGANVVVTVVEGTVAVTHGSGRSRIIGAARTALPPLALRAGQQAVVNPTAGVESVRKVDSGDELAWAVGRLEFQDWTVAEVIARFNRHNQLQVRVSDPVLAQRRVSGVFEISDPESFVSFIQSQTPVRVVRGEDDLTLAPVE
jgi:transmembrane sensor